MREILFRAKRSDNGEWIEGDLITYGTGEVAILKEKFSKYGCEATEISHRIRVNPETVCQYTGLTDKNGVKIFENDVVFVTDDNGCSGQVDTGVGEIDFLEGLWYISGDVQNSLYDIDKCFQIEVIGNIFDNPELMEGGVEGEDSIV